MARWLITFMDGPDDEIPFTTGDLTGRDLVVLVNAVVAMAAERGWDFRVERVKETQGESWTSLDC